MPGERVRKFLEENHIRFQESEHRPAVDAQRVAQSEHETGWRVAKPVMLRVGERMAMAVVPAPVQVDLAKVRSGLGREDVALASEQEFMGLFPDCELGAEPIFGNLYDLPVYFDRCLRADPYLVFRAGTHTSTLKVATADYLRVVAPEEMDLSVMRA